MGIKRLHRSTLIKRKLCHNQWNWRKCTFSINLKMIEQHQRKYPIIIDKYKYGMYRTGSFHGGSNIYINFLTREDKIVIPQILKIYVLYWCNTYLLHPGLDRTEALIRQHLYCNGIREVVQKDVTNCCTCQRTKGSNKKHGRLTTKEN